MEPDRVIERLEEHHHQIKRSLAEVQALLEDGDASQLKALGLARWQLMRSLRVYQLFKHFEVFDPIIASADSSRAREADELKRRCIAIAVSYQEHVQRWTLARPAQDWPLYLHESDAMLRRIREHLATEAEGVETLIAGLKRTRENRARTG